MSRPRFIALLFALITLAVFLPAGRLGFVTFDDNDYVTENPFVKNGLNATDIRWAFTAGHAGNWHPLTWLSHMADCSLFQLNPGAHHYVNVLIHAANAVLLFTLLLRLTQKLPPAAFIAALFAWHPLHVESVAWISERKDVLSTFFALLSLLSYIKCVQEKSRRSLWLAFLFFTLGLMAKPMLVTLPFIMLLLDWWPLNRLAGARPSPASGLILEKIPFFALTVISCIITFIAQKQGEAVISLTRVPLLLRLENAPVAAVDYLLKLLWPANLCAFYPMPEKIPALQVILSVAVLLIISAAAWRWRLQKPYLIFGWLWFLGTLVPVIGLLQVGGQAMADRYTYIPSIGFFIALIFLARDFAVQLQMPKIVQHGLMTLAAATCILVTEHQLQFWHDGETLFRRVLAVTPANDVALINLGVALQSQDRLEEALPIYRQAEKINSTRYQLHNNIGDILGHMGRHAEALAEYQQAIALRPDNAHLHLSAGMELAALDRFAGALSEFS
ncbi:MAG: tetratricopeptide repeat protein, partial [Verrucomicrobia bacterium]|nr:tetratricopeptide repeat protein [Verrucomicrobiota bacterium]